jgi:hypothetical protein
LLKLSSLLKRLFAFALPMYIMEGGGGGSSEALTTDSFASMLGGEGDNEQPETDSQSADDDQENSEDTAQDEPEQESQEEGEGEDEAQDEQPETDSDPSVIELEVDGEKVALTKEEIEAGYKRQKHYTQSMQNLAREKQEQAEFVKAQMESVTQMSRELGQLHQIDATLEQYRNVDWQTLEATDPTSFGVHLAKFNDLRARRGDVVNQIGQKQHQLTAKQQEVFATQTKEAAAHMATVVPGFGEQHLKQMKDFGLKLGFNAQELAAIADKRVMEALYKASAYDKAQAETKKAVKTVAALPTRAAKPAPAAKPAAEQRTEKLKHRLAQTGSLKDFAALLSL